MSDGFTKLSNNILTSSIWSESNATRILWITLLASCDATGYVSGSVPGIAQMARLTIEGTEAALEILLSPDKYSRTKDCEGRRLVEVDGGWLLLNYAKYRAKRDPEIRKKQNREAQARFREKNSKPKSAKVSQKGSKSAKKEIVSQVQTPISGQKQRNSQPKNQIVSQSGQIVSQASQIKLQTSISGQKKGAVSRQQLRQVKQVGNNRQAISGQKRSSKQIVSQSKPKQSNRGPITEEEAFQDFENYYGKDEEATTTLPQDFRAYWNNKKNLPKIVKLTAKRLTHLNSRFEEKAFSVAWRAIVDGVSSSAFLTGGGDRGWKAGIDWIIHNDTNYIRVLEGAYKENSAKGANHGTFNGQRSEVGQTINSGV